VAMPPLGAEREAEIRARVDFDVALKRLSGDFAAFTDCAFSGIPLGGKPEWVSEILAALRTNSKCTRLDLSSCGLTDGEVQRIAAALVTGGCPEQLRCIDLRNNALTVTGETVAQGLCKVRSSLEVLLGDGMDAAGEGFVHDKVLVEGLTAWHWSELQVPGTQHDVYCPEVISGEGNARVVLSRGFQGSNGTKYTCDDAEFLMGHDSGNLVLVRLEPEARMRLATRLGGDTKLKEQGVVV